jgi:VTC domain-containing protein
MSTPEINPNDPALQIDSRETRDHAREVKFQIDINQAQALREWSRANLKADAHGVGEFGDQYATTSLYFETEEFDVYHRHKSYGRSKYRIRQYNGSPIIFLERKFRTDRLLAKRRTTVPVSEIQKLADEAPDRQWRGFWFHRRILLRRLRPLVQMSYDRTARIAESETGPVRMTVDVNLRVLPMPDRGFIPGTGFPILEGTCIVEVKYRRELPALIKRMVAEFHLAPAHVSKYRAGLGALDYAPKPELKTSPGSPGSSSPPAPPDKPSS